MRTIKLSHQEISLLKEALGIAEKTYSDTYKKLVELTNVRHNENDSDEMKVNYLYHEKSCKFVDLNAKIETGQADV